MSKERETLLKELNQLDGTTKGEEKGGGGKADEGSPARAGAGVYRCLYQHGVHMRMNPSQTAQKCHGIRAQEQGEVTELVDGAEKGINNTRDVLYATASDVLYGTPHPHPHPHPL